MMYFKRHRYKNHSHQEIACLKNLNKYNIAKLNISLKH